MHNHDRGLAFDVRQILGRRRLLGLMGGAGLATIVGCGGDDDSPSSSSSQSTTTSSAPSSSSSTGSVTSEIPDETGGPYPADGTNGPNVLTESGIVRSDITTSFGSSSGTAQGVPLTINLMIADSTKSFAAYSGAAVYLWHCDMEGGYSLYSNGITDQNYLRGVQEADSAGNLSFTSIFPAAYMGRWPHIHFEVYASLADATGGGRPVKTSQLAFPEDICDAVYATSGYEQSVSNMSRTPLDRDMVFSDGYQSQLGTISGDVNSNLAVALAVGA